jgi:cytochrome P450 family 4 subfamily B polypeptide 1
VFLSSEPKLEFIYVPLYPWLGESVLTGSGPKWQRTRRLLTPSFHFDILKPYVKVFSSCADIAVDKWLKVPEGQSVEIFHDVSLLTLDVMLRCTCSFESNCQIIGVHNEYIRSVYDLSRLLYDRMMYFYYYWDTIYFMSKDGKQYKKASDVVHNFSMDVIQSRRKDLEENKLKTEEPTGKRRKYLDFIDTLLQAKDANGVGMTDGEIRAEVDTFMFEGHDTTASGISWMLYNMAKHPEHQAKCHEEVDAFFDSLEDGIVTWDDLTKDSALQYLTMCLKESMRLFPPVPVIGRRLTKDTDFAGKTMPPDSRILLIIYALHRHPDMWDNPEEYDPERFSRENEDKIPPFAYVPFSAGSRNCIGKHFALNEERCILAKILHHFEFSLDEDRPPEVMATMITRAKNGLYLKVKRRHV